MADLGHSQGHEQAYKRPVVILQIDSLNYLNTVMVVPLTSQTKRGNSATTVSVHRGEGELPQERLYEIESVVAFVLGLPL